MKFEPKEFNYRLNCSEYVLHEGDKPVGPLLKEVSIAFDLENGTLHKHGSPEGVQKWYENTRNKLTQSGFSEMAKDLVMITGRFPLDDLNKCLSTSGYVGRMYTLIQEGKLGELSEFPDVAPSNKMSP